MSDEFWRGIARLAGALDKVSYYDVLGVLPDIRGPELAAVYARRVRELHPDRHRREADPERRRMLVSIQARLNEAYRVLSDPAQRAAYDRALASGERRLVGRPAPPQRATAPRTPRARLYFELGEEREKAGDRAGARVQYRLAIQIEPESEAIQDALARVEKPPARAPTAPPAPPQSDFAREDTRHPYARPVKLKCASWDQLITLHARNVSRGGIFVRTAAPLPLGTETQVMLALPDGRQLTLDAEVVRVVAEGGDPKREPAGMGLKFLPMEDDRRQDFEAALQHAAAHAAGAVPASPPPPRAATKPPVGGTPARPLLEQDLFSDRIETGAAPPPDVTLSPTQLAAEGRAALREGRFRDARAKLAEAIRLDPRDRYLRAAFHLASGYDARQEGRAAEAIDHFETALVFDKACDEAIRELRRTRGAR
jgi:uncharacterized protein (TIGR02266 family)